MTEAAKKLGEQPAFPSPHNEGGYFWRGLTKREWLSGTAMSAIITRKIEHAKITPENAGQILALMSLEMADALLEALAKETP